VEMLILEIGNVGFKIGNVGFRSGNVDFGNWKC
jgi:hypothetical protein